MHRVAAFLCVCLSLSRAQLNAAQDLSVESVASIHFGLESNKTEMQGILHQQQYTFKHWPFNICTYNCTACKLVTHQHQHDHRVSMGHQCPCSTEIYHGVFNGPLNLTVKLTVSITQSYSALHASPVNVCSSPGLCFDPRSWPRCELARHGIPQRSTTRFPASTSKISCLFLERCWSEYTEALILVLQPPTCEP